MSKLPTAIESVLIERGKQDDKWGVRNQEPFTWLAILSEEVGESAEAALDLKFGHSIQFPRLLREEVVQIAAVAIAWIENLDRQNGDYDL